MARETEVTAREADVSDYRVKVAHDQAHKLKVWGWLDEHQGSQTRAVGSCAGRAQA